MKKSKFELIIVNEGYVENVYDPRIKKVIRSNNPILILGNFIIKNNANFPINEVDLFWKCISDLADYCDEPQH